MLTDGRRVKHATRCGLAGVVVFIVLHLANYDLSDIPVIEKMRGFELSLLLRNNRQLKIANKVIFPRDAALASNDVWHTAPGNVIYLWCGPAIRHFHFVHYLSVRSLLRHLNPDRLVLFRETVPRVDSKYYYTWFVDLEKQFPFFSHQPIADRTWCSNRQEDHAGVRRWKRPLSAIDAALATVNGGIYVRDDVIFAGEDANVLRQLDRLTIRDQSGDVLVRVLFTSKSPSLQSSERTIVATEIGRTVFEFDNTSSAVDRELNATRRAKGVIHLSATVCSNCVDGSKANTAADEKFTPEAGNFTVKFYVPIENSEFFPSDIWELQGFAGDQLRSAAYDSSTIARSVPDSRQLAPNIGHVVWSNADPMSFSFYLCILSLLYAAKVKAVYVHGDGPPTGPYWKLIKNEPRLYLVRRTLINRKFDRIFGTDVRRREHVSDVWRADILNRYGGLYVDSDVIFFRPLSKDIRSYDAVVANDVGSNPPYPDVYQNGVMLGKPRAEFWRRYLDSMRFYDDKNWLLNSCFMMCKLKERHPSLLRVDSRLQVICLRGECYPSWARGYRSIEPAYSHLESGSMRNWLNDTYAVHHTFPDLPEFSNHRALLANNGTTLFGQIGLYVLRQANKLDFFREFH